LEQARRKGARLVAHRAMVRLIRIDASALGSRRLLRKRLPPYGYRASRDVPWAAPADQRPQLLNRPGHAVFSPDLFADTPGPLPHFPISGCAREEPGQPGRRQVSPRNRGRACAEPRDPLGPEVLVSGSRKYKRGDSGTQRLGGCPRAAVVHDSRNPREEPAVRDFLLEENASRPARQRSRGVTVG